MQNLTTCIITYNEEENIKDCINSVKSFSDEIIVVDSLSKDKTTEIAKSLGAKVILQEFLGHVQQKQFAVDSSSNDWIFSIDADERASEELSNKIIELKKENFNGFHGFYVNRRNYYLGKWIKYGGWYPEKRIRLFNRKFGYWGGKNPHDKVIMKPQSKTGDLNLDIIHFPYKNITHHLDVINKYSTISAKEKIEKGEKVYFYNLIFNPAFKFFKAYVLKKGFLMGKIGFIHATMGAISSFMKYLKTWEMQNEK